MRALWFFFVLVLAAIGAPPAASAGLVRAEITAEYGPTAPGRVVRDLQERATTEELNRLFIQVRPEGLGDRPFSVVALEASGGVTVDLILEGSQGEVRAIAEALALPLEDLVHEVGGDYSATVKVRTSSTGGWALPSFWWPTIGLPPSGGAVPTALLGAVVAIGGALLVVFLVRRGFKGPRRLPLPMLWGAPVLGLLPESLARVGKLYHLQSKPCQAMGYFFLQQAHGHQLERVAICAPTPEAGGTVAVTLGLFLVREGQKVLLVDLSGESNVVPAILTRFGSPPEESGPGTAKGTSIPDLDLLTLSGGNGHLPDLPTAIADGYDRIFFVMAPGQRPRAIPCIDVVLKPSLRAALSGMLRAPRVGWVFFGDGVPLRVSDRYYTRYYYEKLHEVSAT